MSADLLISRLEKVKRTGPGRWMACCPARDDHGPSLSIREEDDGRVLIHDFGANCGAAEVLAAVGLPWDVLFPPRSIDHAKPIRRPVFREDVFKLIQHELAIILMVACDMHKHRAVSEDDYERLFECTERLNRIAEAAYASR